MINSYSKKSMEFIEKNFNQIIDKKNFINVSVGGSVARGYAQNKSDIDLICISKVEEKYKKIFKNICEFPVEIHIIPIQYIYALVESVKKYSNLEYELHNCMDIFCMGAKKCNLIERKQDEITKLFSDWREIKKITDSIILYEDEQLFLTILKRSVNKIKFYDEVYKQFEKNMQNYSNVDKLINMLKLYSLYIGKIFSKVLWTDLYLDNDYNQEIKKIILENIVIDTDNIDCFYKWVKREYDFIIEKHATINCEFCKDDYLQCNILRCIHDYIIDAKKARNNEMKLGELLSIKKVIEYVSLLYKKLNIKDSELEKINSKIILDDKTINNIWSLIKKECKENACKE